MWYRLAQNYDINGNLVEDQILAEPPENPAPQNVEEPKQDIPAGTDVVKPVQDLTAGMRLPPIHQFCHCYIKEYPGGKKVWQFGENCCEECKGLALDFNTKQDQMYSQS